jgi:hypothetical protein
MGHTASLRRGASAGGGIEATAGDGTGAMAGDEAGEMAGDGTGETVGGGTENTVSGGGRYIYRRKRTTVTSKKSQHDQVCRRKT